MHTSRSINITENAMRLVRNPKEAESEDHKRMMVIPERNDKQATLTEIVKRFFPI